MKKTLTPTSLLALLAVVALVLVGCASSGGGDVAPAAAAAPAAPAKKAFVAPDWESTEFASAEHGFQVHYPAEFSEADAGDSLFAAASPQQVPRIDLNFVPLPPSTPIDQVGAAIADTLKQVGGGEAEVKEAKAVTLRDGVTEAMEFTLDWTFQGFPLESIIVGAPSASGSGIVTVMATGMSGGDMAQLADIAYTLYFD